MDGLYHGHARERPGERDGVLAELDLGRAEHRHPQQRSWRSFGTVVEDAEDVHVATLDRRGDQILGVVGGADHDQVGSQPSV
jgi:hypothetical protein